VSELDIPSVAWSRAIGLGYEPEPRPRVRTPMIDDGPWAGVPIGGIGSGSIGRTQRGDFARRHLRIGEHEFRPGGVDGFAVWWDDGGGPRATTLRTIAGPPGWGPPLPVGAGTYHALAPRAWFDYDLPGGALGLREEQLSPVVPGDDASASLPVGAFEFELENRLDRPIRAAVLLTWHDDLGQVTGDPDDAASPAERADLEGVTAVTWARSNGLDGPGSFAIAVERRADLDITAAASGGLGAQWRAFAADGRLADGPPSAGADGVASVAARVELAPGGRTLVRFSIAWDVPLVRFGSGRRWTRRYTREWGTSGARAAELAARAVTCLPEWRTAIETWQRPILDAPDRPPWYKAALFNELYFLVDGGTFWPDRMLDGAPERETAELAILECFDYPFYDTLDVHFYASFALSALWPQLQVSISRAYAATVAIDDRTEITVEASGETALRKVAGALPHDLGGPAEDPLVRVNRYAFQEVNGWKDLNPKFVLQAWRDAALAEGRDAFLAELWPAVVAAMDHVAALDRDGDGLPEHDGRPDQTYDTWPMRGPSAYGGSLWLAALRAAAAWAMAVGQEERGRAWNADFERAASSFVERLWTGRSFRYDGSDGPSSDSVMADQLVGQWYADVCDLGDLVPPAMVESALRHVYESNVDAFADGLSGAVNGMRPDGLVDRSSEQSEEVWIGTSYALAAFMLGRGLDEEGWTTAEGAARGTYARGLWFRTPEAYDRRGDFRASLYLRPLAIWSIEEALARRAAGDRRGVMAGPGGVHRP
jgi:non-lysosomal glucosylceramidase